MNKFKRNYSQLFAICKKHGWDYKDKVAEFTKNYTDQEHESLSSLTDPQYEEFMVLVLELNKGHRKDFNKKPGDPQRKKLIAIALTMFWGNETSEAVKAVDEWIRKQKFKKGLMAHSPAELDLMVAIMEQKVYPDYLKSLRK